ncbi:hypothetical protein GCM10007924_19220 [Sneathiella chinensis]|uniref:Uncharacterized protein n=1 Tax=Sneathiella chinensis TaxID=349750 RepID=A0ABQ5U898_9PROT|nr:hypothetical protein GCM10007924_19220 [Sneathiella chinensis]
MAGDGVLSSHGDEMLSLDRITSLSFPDDFTDEAYRILFFVTLSLHSSNPNHKKLFKRAFFERYVDLGCKLHV